MKIRKNKNCVDMTKGKTSSLMLRFTLPLMAGNLFQQLYSITDAAIIGRSIGVEAFGAINAVSWIIWFLNAVSRDSSNVFCIVASVRTGRKDETGFKNVVFHSILVGGTISVLVTALMLFFQKPLMILLNVPEASFRTSYQYLLVAILSFPINLAFHQASALLRAVGDSHTTFISMCISTTTNILLDMLFVLYFHWGVLGASIATAIAQVLSAGIALQKIKKGSLFWLTKADYQLNPALMREIFQIWMPQALNSFVLTLGGTYVQSSYNTIGTSFTAGYSASTKVFSIAEAIMMAIQTGASVFVGQNLGAKQPDRIKKGLREIVNLALLLSVTIICFCWYLDKQVIDFFLSKDNLHAYLEAHRYGVIFLHFQITGLLIMSPMYIYRITIQTIGLSKYALIAGILQMIVRIATISLLPKWIGEYAYYMPTVLAWTVSLPVVYFPYQNFINKKMRVDCKNQVGHLSKKSIVVNVNEK